MNTAESEAAAAVGPPSPVQPVRTNRKHFDVCDCTGDSNNGVDIFFYRNVWPLARVPLLSRSKTGEVEVTVAQGMCKRERLLENDDDVMERN